MNKRDLIIIGGGAGGLVVASVAAQLGLKVTLIDKAEKLGGDCLHHGCVPSKTLIKTAKVASLMRRGKEFGLDSIETKIDLTKVNAHIQSVIEYIQQHDDPKRFLDYGCDVLLGHSAEFISPHTVRVNDKIIAGKRLVIAAGARPYIPDIPGLQETGFITNLELFSLSTLPPRLVVLGAGPIGLEMGQAMARLGSEVTIITRGTHILPKDDPELTDSLQDILASEGIAIISLCKAQRISKDNNEIIIECSGKRTIKTDLIMVSTGRQPNIENLGLDAAGVQHTRKGINVDRRQRTSQKHIFACGDICGPYAFTHMAEYQAGIVISNAIFRFPKKTNYRVVPHVTYTDPELAQVGLTEQQAREQGIEPTVLRFQFNDNDRALAEVETHGLNKLITHKGRILGASILGPHAGELIHEIVLAMQTRAKASDISEAIHAYPTLAQIQRRTVNTLYTPRLFNSRTRKLVKWINRLLP